MSTSDRTAIIAYIAEAQRTLAAGYYNLDGGYTGVAVGRAYYAFFYAAGALLLTKGISRSKHSGVLSSFRQHFVKTGVFSPEMSDAYGKAMEAREAADYDLLTNFDEAEATNLLTQAQAFVEQSLDYLEAQGYA